MKFASAILALAASCFGQASEEYTVKLELATGVLQSALLGHEIQAQAGILTAELPGKLSVTIEHLGAKEVAVHIPGAEPEVLALLPNQTSLVYVQRDLSRFKLPYQIAYQPGIDGKPDSLYWAPAYRAEGMLSIGNCSVRIALLDLNGDGEFKSDDSARGTTLLVDANGDGTFYGAAEHRNADEILELCGTALQTKSVDPQGKFIVFRKSDFAAAAIGKRIPSFTVTDTKGAVLHSEDLRGKWTVIDFWASWCVPCVEDLAKSEQVFGSRKDVKLIQWNIESADRREKAERLIALKKLSGTQIIRGLDDKDNLWRLLGSVEGGQLTVPLFLLIDSDGTVRAVSRTLGQMDNTLKSVLN